MLLRSFINLLFINFSSKTKFVSSILPCILKFLLPFLTSNSSKNKSVLLYFNSNCLSSIISFFKLKVKFILSNLCSLNNSIFPFFTNPLIIKLSFIFPLSSKLILISAIRKPSFIKFSKIKSLVSFSIPLINDINFFIFNELVEISKLVNANLSFINDFNEK